MYIIIRFLITFLYLFKCKFFYLKCTPFKYPVKYIYPVQTGRLLLGGYYVIRESYSYNPMSLKR